MPITMFIFGKVAWSWRYDLFSKDSTIVSEILFCQAPSVAPSAADFRFRNYVWVVFCKNSFPKKLCGIIPIFHLHLLKNKRKHFLTVCIYLVASYFVEHLSLLNNIRSYKDMSRICRLSVLCLQSQALWKTSKAIHFL